MGDHASFFASLLKTLSEQALPHAANRGMTHILTARPTWQEMKATAKALPSEVVLTPRKIRGRRQAVREGFYRRANQVSARWPGDALVAVRHPIMIGVMAGPATIKFGEYSMTCDSGTFIVVPAGVPFPDRLRQQPEETGREGDHCDLLWLYSWAAASGLEGGLWHVRNSRYYQDELGEGFYILDTRVAHYFHDLADAAVSLEPSCDDDRRLCQALLITTLSALLRELGAGRGLHPMRSGMEAQPVTDRDTAIGQAQRYIASHMTRHLTIADVCRAVYMSRTQLTRRFRQETGMSFTEYLRELRLAEAKRMLRDTDWSIQVICESVGFVATSYLRKLLQQREGVSPTEYRTRSRRAD